MATEIEKAYIESLLKQISGLDEELLQEFLIEFQERFCLACGYRIGDCDCVRDL